MERNVVNRFEPPRVFHAKAEQRLILIKHYFKEVLHHTMSTTADKVLVGPGAWIQKDSTRHGVPRLMIHADRASVRADVVDEASTRSHTDFGTKRSEPTVASGEQGCDTAAH